MKYENMAIPTVNFCSIQFAFYTAIIKSSDLISTYFSVIFLLSIGVPQNFQCISIKVLIVWLLSSLSLCLCFVSKYKRQLFLLCLFTTKRKPETSFIYIICLSQPFSVDVRNYLYRVLTFCGALGRGSLSSPASQSSSPVTTPRAPQLLPRPPGDRRGRGRGLVER